jgi:hypothetical protein
MTDVDQIAAWFEDQAAKERAHLDSKDIRPDAIQLAQERWLVYKASAQAVRSGAWKKTP